MKRLFSQYENKGNIGSSITKVIDITLPGTIRVSDELDFKFVLQIKQSVSSSIVFKINNNTISLPGIVPLHEFSPDPNAVNMVDIKISKDGGIAVATVINPQGGAISTFIAPDFLGTSEQIIVLLTIESTGESSADDDIVLKYATIDYVSVL